MGKLCEFHDVVQLQMSKVWWNESQQISMTHVDIQIWLELGLGWDSKCGDEK